MNVAMNIYKALYILARCSNLSLLLVVCYTLIKVITLERIYTIAFLLRVIVREKT